MNLQRYEYDNEKRLIIKINMLNATSVFDEFSTKEHPIISSNVIEYIQKFILNTKIDEKYILKIQVDEHLVRRENIETGIKNYYISKYIENEKSLRRYRFISLILGLIGASVLTLVIILEYLNKSEFWMRIFDIVSWVFIWEAVDIIAFKCKQLRLEQIRNLNMINMDILFVDKIFRKRTNL